MSLLEGLMDAAYFDGSSCQRAIPAPRDETWLEQQGLGTKSCADAWCKLLRTHTKQTELINIKFLPGDRPWRKPRVELPCWHPSHDDTKYWR